MAFSDKVESGLTVDKIIEKFIPVIGAICFVVGLGYLLYTSVWINIPVELKLWLGFFASLVLIWWGFSFEKKLRYFADVTIGAGILMLYGTLIYGSRTTWMGSSMVIPEVATLIVASLVTIGTAYFASLRNSKVILALGLLGSYLTPFIIGGEWWTSALSFNSYLIYFLVANVSIFLLWKEIALKDLIPLNIAGLFFGTSSLYVLWYGDFWGNIVINNQTFLSSATLSAIIIFFLVIFSIFSIVISAKKFESKEESFLTVWYILPLVWFLVNVSLLWRDIIWVWWVTGLYILLSIAYFSAWRYVRSLETSYQHVSLYVGWVIALVFAWIDIFPELNYISSTIIAYIGLIFAGLFFYDSKKWERFITYLTFALFGGFLGVYYFYTESSIGNIWFLFVILTLIPASLAYLVIQKAEPKIYTKLTPIATLASVMSLVTMFFATVSDLMEVVWLAFAVWVLPALGLVGTALLSPKLTSEKRSAFLQAGMAFLTFWFISKFFFLVTMLVPRAADHLSLSHSASIIINSLFALAILFAGLYLSRSLQIERKEKRPSFLLVIFGYSTLVLFVNYLIIVWMNDLGVAVGTTWWPRAIATTIWWIIVAAIMMTIGLRNGKMYNSEKLLGLLLLAITIWKIVFYDMSTMGTDKKVIVLMIVWGILMSLSYFFHTKEWFSSKEPLTNGNQTPKI